MVSFFIGYAITTTALLLSIFYLSKAIRAQARQVTRLSKYVELVISGSGNPHLRQVFIKLSEIPDHQLKDVDIKEMMASEALSAINKLVGHLKAEATAIPDPEEKKEVEAALKEMDSITTLMSTVDKQSSPEYIDNVLADIVASLKKLRE